MKIKSKITVQYVINFIMCNILEFILFKIRISLTSEFCKIQDSTLQQNKLYREKNHLIHTSGHTFLHRINHHYSRKLTLRRERIYYYEILKFFLELRSSKVHIFRKVIYSLKFFHWDTAKALGKIPDDFDSRKLIGNLANCL